MEVSSCLDICISFNNLWFLNLPVFVQAPKGNNVFLETQPSYTIGQVKTMIPEKIGVPTDELKLIFSDQLLEDEHTLSDYKIQGGATVTYNYCTGEVAVQVLFSYSLLITQMFNC